MANHKQELFFYFDGNQYLLIEGEPVTIQTWKHEHSLIIAHSSVLPSVLSVNKPHSSISMVRALKQIKELLTASMANYTEDAFTPELEDSFNASLDDIETMLAAIK